MSMIESKVQLPSYAGKVEAPRSECVAMNAPKPRIKVIQAMTEAGLKKQFGEGAILLSPDNVLLAKKGDSFVAIPLYLWETAEKWSDNNDDKSPTVMASTTDPASALWRRAIGPKDQRLEKYGPGGQFTAKYFHGINAMLQIDDGPLAGTVAVASWRSGGKSSGEKMCGLLNERQKLGVPIFASRLKFSVVEIEGGKYTWLALAASNPSATPFVSEDRLPSLRTVYDSFEKLHAQSGIYVADEAKNNASAPSGYVPPDEGQIPI